MKYLIAFACYGNRLHGDPSGSIDPAHNQFDSPLVIDSAARVRFEKTRMGQEPYRMDGARRRVVLEAIQEVCAHRGWGLLAAHVRSNHVHTVVNAEAQPGRVMTEFKAYASRRLNESCLDRPNRKCWARHGSTRWLWKPREVSAAVSYVMQEQGEPMSVFESEHD